METHGQASLGPWHPFGEGHSPEEEKFWVVETHSLDGHDISDFGKQRYFR
jgi:hypothetical protein